MVTLKKLPFQNFENKNDEKFYNIGSRIRLLTWADLFLRKIRMFLIEI